MLRQTTLCVYIFYVIFTSKSFLVSSGDAPADSLATNRYGAPPAAHHIDKAPPQNHPQHYAPPIATNQQHGSVAGSNQPVASNYHPQPPTGSGHIEKRNSYNLLSEAMSQAVSNEFSASLGSGSADGACHVDDMECYTNSVQDRLGMEAIRTLHQQLDDDDNGNIDLSESDDFLREELKYDSGYEKRQKAFHFNDDMHISVKELWEAWLRSEVHNWTIEQTTDWLAQSVQLPQYVELFKVHKVTGAALPRLAVNNMHYVGNVLGIKDPIHKQKIALKAMDVVLFGPPRETGTRWKDYILVTLLLSAIIGCWYAYQQNKNAKRHLRRMAQDMEGLQRAEQSLQEMQKELERARLEQESVETEKMDLERRLKEAPLLTSSNSDLEVQQLKKEIEMLRSELSRAEIELVDNCWTPPPQLQSWLQYTYELESKNHLKKRISAEKQLQSAREACEKLRKKRSSLVGAFVSTHGKSIDDVDRSIVEARNSLGEVTNELQERLHRWKQIESCLGFNIVNNNGLQYLESVLYGRNGGGGTTVSNKGSRGRMTSSTDDLDDESVQGIFDSYTRSPASASALINSGSVSSVSNTINSNYRDDSSSDDGINDTPSAVQFYLGNAPPSQTILSASSPERPIRSSQLMVTTQAQAQEPGLNATAASSNHINAVSFSGTPTSPNLPSTPALLLHNNAQYSNFIMNDSQMLRSQSDLVPMEVHTYFSNRPQSIQHQQQQHSQQFCSGIGSANTTVAPTSGNPSKKMVKQHSTASQQSSSSTSSSVQSAPPAVAAVAAATTSDTTSGAAGDLSDRWLLPERANHFYGYGDKEQPHQSNKHAVTSAFVQQLPTTFSLQQFCNNAQCENFQGMSSNSPSKSSSTATSSHGYTELEKCIAADTVSLSDTVSLDGGTKKRRRRLRFPFGSSKKSSAAARSSDSVNDDTVSNASKSKFT